MMKAALGLAGMSALVARWHVQVSESTGFTQSPTSYEITTANNTMLARYSAHHEPFYRALRARRIAIS